MKIVDEFRFRSLVSDGRIVHQECQFLDGIKIGLRIRPIGRVLPATIDASNEPSIKSAEIDMRSIALKPGELYLLETLEKICLPDTIFGLLHTRSSIARYGINCIGSSNFVAPGFGQGTPRSLILETTSMKTVEKLSLENPLAGLLLFEMSSSVRTRAPSTNTFPFSPS